MTSILGIDVGNVRIGLAIARSDIAFPKPLITLSRQNNGFWEELLQIITDNNITQIVIGLPRNLDGDETSQTKFVKQFASELSTKTKVSVAWQDEALTTVKAKEILNLSRQPYQIQQVDSMAASIILSDFIESQKVK